MPSDPQERAIDVIADSAKVMERVARRVDSLERKFETLEGTLNTRMENLEHEMGTMNAHLDNLVREAQTTNQLLRAESTERRAETLRRQTLEDDERKHRRNLEKDQRETVKRVGSELWGMFRQPLGYLVAGVVAWLLYTYFAVPLAAGEGMFAAPVVGEQVPEE